MNPPKRTSMYDRAKDTGFVTGAAAASRMSAPKTQEVGPEMEESEVQPPGYRAASSCSSCAHFDPEHHNPCRQFDFPCEEGGTCDEHEALDQPQEVAEEYGGTESAQSD